MASANAQINIRLPPKLQSAAEQYVDNYGYRNIQEFVLEAIRDKIFRDNKYDETFSDKEIDLIEKLLSVSIEEGKIKDQNDIIKALQ
jgi:Arc/MetJ-type ribon-helix-helix transcriptional regulator